MRERKDESNALQQRTVTDQAFIWVETAAVAGRTQQQRRQQHSSIIQCLQHSWIRGGHEEAEAQGIHTNTSPMPPGILCWLFQLCLGAYQFLSPPDTLQFICCPFLLSWFEGVFMPRESVAWMRISGSLYRSDVGTSRRLKRHSAHYANLLSTPLRSPSVLSHSSFSQPVERSQESYWHWGVHMTTCPPNRPQLFSFFSFFLYGYWVFWSMWIGSKD